MLTEVLVIDKTRNVSYSVQNRDMLDRGGQCRRVVYTPGQSTWAAMRYTGEYQIRQSREEELTIELGLAGCFPAFPGDTVRLELGPWASPASTGWPRRKTRPPRRRERSVH